MPICRKLLAHCVRAAASRAFCTAGINRAAKMEMMAITTSSSIRVKPRRPLRRPVVLKFIEKSSVGKTTVSPRHRSMRESLETRFEEMMNALGIQYETLWLDEIQHFAGKEWSWVPCFRGGLAQPAMFQSHRESMAPQYALFQPDDR